MRRTPLVLVLAAVLGGSAIVAATDEPLFGPMTPARISGEWVYRDHLSEGEVVMDSELTGRMEGARSAFTISSNDPRFGGEAVVTGSWDGWWPPALVAITESQWVVGDTGDTWTGSSRMAASIADEDPINVPEQLILDGAGAYEGLTAYVVVDHEDETFVGVIVPDEQPELPADWLEIVQASAAEDAAEGD